MIRRPLKWRYHAGRRRTHRSSWLTKTENSSARGGRGFGRRSPGPPLCSELLRTPYRRSSQDPEILWKSAGSESQQLATFPRPVCDDVGRCSGVVAFNPTRWQLHWRRDAGDCYCELRRIPLPRSRVNKGMKKGPRLLRPDPSLVATQPGRSRGPRGSCQQGDARSQRMCWKHWLAT
jgi:hypothetical protein